MSESEQPTNPQPRLEARPVSWDELTENQRKAAITVHDLLVHQAQDGERVSKFHRREKSEPEALVRVLPPVELKRHARVYLIEGDRGSGKTVLLISLIHHWNQLAQHQPPHFADLSDEPHHVVIPIGLFDLRTVPRRAALKVHLASMLRRLYEYVAAGSPSSIPLPGSPHSRPNSLTEAWQNFVSATAADEVVFRKRAAMVDPETFAEEIHAAERNRFDLTALFSGLIDALVEHYTETKRRREGEMPLFVIAIDDVDMNPDCVVECLELTQTFTHPRVAYLLTGHEELFATTLEKYFTEQLSDATDAEWQARRLAWQFYDKCVPEQQRVRLFDLGPEERATRLNGILRQINFDHPKITAAQLFETFPMFAEALPSTMRDLQDLEAGLSMRRGNQPGPSAAELLWRIIRLQKKFASDAEQNLLSAIYREQLAFEGRLAKISAEDIQLNFRTRDFSGWVGWGTFGGGPQPFNRIEIQPYQIEAIEAQVDDIVLSKGIRATLTFASLMFSEPASRTAKRATPDTVHVSLRGANNTIHTAWPFPPMAGLELAEFARKWGQWVSRASGTIEITPEVLARTYVECFLSIAFNRPMKNEPDSWTELIPSLAGTLRYDELLLLAAPESGIPAAIRSQILDSWKAVGNLDYWPSVKLFIRRSRAARLTPAEQDLLRSGFGDDDPWYVAVEYAESDLGQLGPLLRRPLICKNPVSATLEVYLTNDLRELLRKDVDSVDALVLTLQADPRGDERKRLAQAVPQGVIRWDGTRLEIGGYVSTFAKSWFIQHDTTIGETRFAYGLADGALAWPASNYSAAAQVAFLLAHDLAADRQAESNGWRTQTAWPLFRVENLESGDVVHPWTVPAWPTHVDQYACLVGWHEITTRVESSEGNLGEIIRRFANLQLDIYSRERKPEPEMAPTWFDILDRASQKIADGALARHHRRSILSKWIESLHKLAEPWSLIPNKEIVELILALRRIDENIAFEGKTGTLTRLKTFLPGGHERMFGDGMPGNLLLDVLAELLVRQYDVENLRESVGSEERAAMVSELFETLEKANCAQHLTPDLLGYIRESPLPALRSAMNILAGMSPGKEIEALTRAWTALHSGGRAAAVVLFADGRLIVNANYRPCEALSEPDLIETKIPGLWLRYYRGTPTSGRNQMLAEVFKALLYEHFRHSETDGVFEPIQWPLAQYETTNKRGITPWPCVQWPHRADVYHQVVGWHDSLDKKRSNSVAALIREYISTVADVYEFGEKRSGYPGSWKDVLTRAWTLRDRKEAAETKSTRTTKASMTRNKKTKISNQAAKAKAAKAKAAKAKAAKARVARFSHPLRDSAYRAWTSQLVRFALPRVGLSHKYAADIIVRLWDINHLDPRPELLGRTSQLRDDQVNLPVPPDHPARMLTETENLNLPSFMKYLRKTYELG